MRKIKVLIANCPQMMRDVMRSLIERQPDMEVVGEALEPLEVLLAAKETEADAVIVALKASNEGGLCSHLFAECPNVTILELASSGNTAFIEQLCPWRREIVDASEVKILNALRRAIRAPCSMEDEENPGQSP